jgi:hypothetical protein
LLIHAHDPRVAGVEGKRPVLGNRRNPHDKASRVAPYIQCALRGLVEPASVPRVVVGNVDDQQVIGAAVAARADLIVSGGSQVSAPLGDHQGIEIIDAAESIRRIVIG